MSSPRVSAPQRREIWLVNFDPTVGTEIQKTRPAVVVNSDAVGRLPIKLVAPITDWKENPFTMIEQAFHAYTKAVETKFEEKRRPPTNKGSLVEWLNRDDHLRALVKQLEDGHEFRALLEATRSEFRSDDWHSAKGASWWRDPIRNFFCRTGYYTDTFAGSDAPCALFERYEAAFQRRSVHTKYMAPLEFVNFPKSELKFSGFEIRKFDRKELEEIAGNDVNRVFYYPYAVVDTRILQEYWFIVVKKPEKAPRLRPPLLTISKEAVG